MAAGVALPSKGRTCLVNGRGAGGGPDTRLQNGGRRVCGPCHAATKGLGKSLRA